MRQELIEIITKDKVSLMGMLFTPLDKSQKTVIHIHGLADNFYQRRFVRELAKMYASIGYNFLSFNTRGHDYATIIIKEDKSVRGGTYNELLSDSLIDIEAVVGFVKDIGTEEIILEGHSLGCSKLINYYNENKMPMITKIILLAPSDGITKFKQIMKDGYDYFYNMAKELHGSERENEVLCNPDFFPQSFTAKVFIENFTEDGLADTFRYRDDTYVNPVLKSVEIPILIEVGTIDRMAFIAERDDITPYWNRNNDNYKLDFIVGADHEYVGLEEKLCDNIKKWLNN